MKIGIIIANGQIIITYDCVISVVLALALLLLGIIIVEINVNRRVKMINTLDSKPFFILHTSFPTKQRKKQIKQ